MSKKIINVVKIILKLGLSKLVLSSGMPRSGSTLLFNIIRLCLEKKYQNGLVSGWVGDLMELPNGKIYLIKLHGIRRIYTYRASLIFYSYRDVRDALVSVERKFGTTPSIDLCRSYIKEYVLAKKYANYMFKYEDFSDNLESTIHFISKILNIKLDSAEILKNIPSVSLDLLNEGYDKKTLLHGGHSTGTESGAWKNSLSIKLQDQINNEFHWWFKENNYDLR